jgi:hypothetical protein
MRKMLLSALLAASVSVPAVALAAEARGVNINPQTQSGLMNQPVERDTRFIPRQQPANAVPSNTIGAGMQLGDEPGHTAGPGGAKVDGDARGPVNDIQVGRGTDDVPQSKNPVPVQ